MSSTITDQIIQVFHQRGSESYGSEAVNQLQHAIQAAVLAQRDGADEQLVVAALLHDIGHILGHAPLPTDATENYDDKHEMRGYAWLLKHFGPRIADPVRLHVAAKRYLCTVEPTYSQRLSPTSLKSFYDQGGLMNSEEKATFEQEPFFEEALRLRRWDDEAKDPEMQLPVVEAFRTMLNNAVASES